MSLLSSILGGGVAEPVKAVGTILDDLFTSDEERLDQGTSAASIGAAPGAGAGRNQQGRSATSQRLRRWMAALYRLGLRRSACLQLHSAGPDRLAIVTGSHDLAPPPELAMEHLITILMALLGLGGFRTFEKLAGRTK